MYSVKFTDAFVDFAYRIVMKHSCETDKDRALFDLICEICDKYEFPVSDFIKAVQELAERLPHD